MWNWKQGLFAFVLAISLINQAVAWAPFFKHEAEQTPNSPSSGKVMVATNRKTDKDDDDALASKSTFPIKERVIPC